MIEICYFSYKTGGETKYMHVGKGPQLKQLSQHLRLFYLALPNVYQEECRGSFTKSAKDKPKWKD